MRRPEGFTSRRRRCLAKKVDRLDRLENRTTMTEPISAVGLLMGSLRWLDQLGIVDKRMLGNPVSGLAPLDQVSAPGQAQAQKPRPAPDSSDSIMASTLRGDSAGGAGGGSATPADPTATARASANNSDDWLAFNTSSGSGSTESGFSTPWQPAKGPGGGAALPPRGGSVGGPRGSRPAVRGSIARPTLPPSIPSAHIGGNFAPSPYVPPIGGAGNGHHASAGSQPGAPAAPAGGTGSSAPAGSAPAAGPSADDSGGSSPAPTGPTIIPENPSSLPYTPPVITDGSPPPPGAPAFPLYTLDYIQGTVLLPNAVQLATPGGSMDLRAQATGTTGVTYSWNTSGLTAATGIAGASTYDLTFSWSNHTSAELDSVTLTATNSSSQQVVQTYYFEVPAASVSNSPSSANWPTTLAPNTVSLNATEWASQYVSVNSNSGALDTEIDLPSYNPNVPALALTYDSLTANPLPMIVVEHPLDPTQAVPTKVSAQLTFDGTAGTTYYFNTSQWTPGDVEQIALQATSASTLATGRYSYSVQVVDYRTSNTTTTYTGTATMLNQSSSAFGDGWMLEGLEKIIPATDNSGVILNLRDAGASLWFAGNPSVGGTYTTPPGDFSTLTKTSTGYTDVLPDGTQITFNSSGYETATIDLNNQHITYSYNGSNQLTTITDNYSNTTTFTYSGSDLSTIKDPAGRLTTFTFSGADLAAVQQADGTHVSFSYDSAGRLTQVKDPLSNSVTVSYDSAERVGTIMRPDLTTEEFSPYQEQGYNTSGTSGSPAPTVLLAASVASFTDPNLNTTTLRPDWFGLGVTGILTDAVGNFTTYDNNSNGLPTITIDRLDRITQYSYDSLGNMTEEIYPDLNTDQYTYNSDSEPLTHTDANNHTTSYSYDSHGNLTVIQDPLNNRTTMTYTSTGRLQTSDDANNHTTTYQYDSQDRVTTVINPDNTTVLTSYNSQGNAIKVTDERGNSTTFSFDSMNRETGSTDALNDTTTYVYDSDGNLKVDEEPTPAGQTARTTTYAYDSMNRLTTTTAPLSLTTVNSYDSDGNLIAVKDPMGRITTTVYDQLNRPVVTIDPMGNHVTTTYDAEGQVVTVTDAMNRITTYTYSIRGWVRAITLIDALLSRIIDGLPLLPLAA